MQHFCKKISQKNIQHWKCSKPHEIKKKTNSLSNLILLKFETELEVKFWALKMCPLVVSHIVTIAIAIKKFMNRGCFFWDKSHSARPESQCTQNYIYTDRTAAPRTAPAPYTFDCTHFGEEKKTKPTRHQDEKKAKFWSKSWPASNG